MMILFNNTLIAQHHHADSTKKDSSKPAPSMQHHHMDHDMKMDDPMNMEQHDNMSMSHSFSRNLPMTRNGSGTSWLPDNSPMYAYMFHSKKWMYMLHGDIYLRYNKQDLFNKGHRGAGKFDAPNMVMLMGQRNVGKKGLFHFNSMFSLDPLTVGKAGYPLLFQTGESYKGQPLVDRQHPHDLIAELSASYAYAISPKADVFVYAAYPGEPALGPAVFVHRPSGFFNPDAPLSHHWVDATHITFGVATLGVRLGNFKLEGSSFTGREPDEDRYNFDKPRFDSWSGRLSYNPSPAWALQVSHGFIKQPEALHPGENIYRTTASATYSKKASGNVFTNITGLWGMNKIAGHEASNAVLLEAAHSIKKTTLYGRYEFVQKSAEELNLDDEFETNPLFPVHMLTAGLSRDVLNIGKTIIAVGTQLSVYRPDEKLRGLYGNYPMAGEVYVRIYPMRMGN